MKNKFLTLIMALSLIFAVSCSQAIGGVESSIYETGQVKNIKVTAAKANITSGCANNSPVIQTGKKDNKYTVLNEVADWYAVQLPNKKVGFIPKKSCTPIVAEDKEANIPPETSGAAPQGATTAKTPNEQTNNGSLNDSEKQMLKLVNKSRSENNLKPLEVDIQLSNVARTKSQDMIDNNYFSHNSPKYGSPFDMMKAFGIKYVKAGENIAGNQSVQNAQNSLMNSPGHRKNILSPDFTHIGIGITKGGDYGNMFTQMFISKPK